MTRACRALLLCAVLLTGYNATGRAQITLYRDNYGLPSIQAGNMEDALYGLGYVTATDNAERMALNYKQARGRLGEAVGRSALLTDGFLRSLGLEEMAERKAKSLQGAVARWLQSYCDGANRALAEQKGRLPDWIEPFTLVDILALSQLLNAAFPLQDISNELLPGTGSNQFAVSPKRSASGHALLSADPHLNWSGPLLWYEYSLYLPDLKFHGVGISGLPFPAMGHSDRVAWSMTNNSPDLYDFYIVKTNPDNARQYNYHGEWRDFEEMTYELRWRENGELKTQKQTARRTAWGPMVPLRPWAARLSMLDTWEGLEQMVRMAKARDGKEFREALKPRGLSMWNIVYADTKGTIGYQYNARLPRKSEGFDWTKPVPGSDPGTKWGELWTLDDLPHIENPKSNLLVNANTAPDLTPLGTEIPANRWPKYVTSYGHTTRYDRLAALLDADNSITVEEAKRYATDTEVPHALQTVRALQKAASAGAMEPELREALNVLTAWNGRAEVDTPGCGLYLYWFRGGKESLTLAEKAGSGTAWNDMDAAAALAALKQAAADMKQQHGSLTVPWGKLHLSRRGSVTAPVSGFAYARGRGDSVATVAPNFGVFRDGVLTCTGGSSFRMIVELDPKGVRSWSILPYGVSQNPANPHYADQMALFGRGEYKDTYFGLARIQKSAASKQTLNR